MNLFRVIVLGVFAFFTVLAILIFSGLIRVGNQDPMSQVGGEVVLWGTIPREVIGGPLEEFKREHDANFILRYEERRAATFDRDLVEALASGVGPDLVLLPHDLIMRHSDKIFPVPYESFSAREFQDTFIEEGELYLRADGIGALPFSIDPLVMYYNRDIFSSEAIARPPQMWDELLTLVPQLTRTDEARNILRSGVALGEFRNVDHAKDILSLLILQAENPIVEVVDGNPRSALADDRNRQTPPAESALTFYTNFSNAANPVYSWNRSLPPSQDLFVAGDVAMYLGYASERAEIFARSPHLNFDVAEIPQIREAPRRSTFGRMSAVAVMRASENPGTAFFAAFLLSGRDFVEDVTEANGLPAVRRDLLGGGASEAHREVFNRSALMSRAWLDPEPQETAQIFQEMVENVVSGRRRIGEAVDRADRELADLLSLPR